MKGIGEREQLKARDYDKEACGDEKACSIISDHVIKISPSPFSVVQNALGALHSGFRARPHPVPSIPVAEYAHSPVFKSEFMSEHFPTRRSARATNHHEPTVAG